MITTMNTFRQAAKKILLVIICDPLHLMKIQTDDNINVKAIFAFILKFHSRGKQKGCKPIAFHIWHEKKIRMDPNTY